MKILVIQQKMIGDVLTSSILFEALRKKYPAAQLHYLIYRHTLAVVENNPHIDRFLLYDDSYKKTGKLLKFLQQIRKEEYDIVIDVYAKLGTALMSSFSGAGIRISYNKWYTSPAYTTTFKPKKNLQTNAGFAIENRMQLLQGISTDFPAEIRPKIYLTETERSSVKQRLVTAGISMDRPLVMCGILGSSGEKTYPLPYMARILDFVVERTGAQLLFNYIPKQETEARELLALCRVETQKQVFFELFGKSLREFMSLTSHCDALIGNEGGAVNMAKALDIPTFAIFSPQIKKEDWSIYEDGKHHVSVHLSDFISTPLDRFSKKERVKKGPGFYKKFKPDLIITPLQKFLDHCCGKDSAKKL